MGKLNLSDNIFFGNFENGNLHGRVQILKNGKIAFEGYYINGELDITQTGSIFYQDYFYLGYVNKKLEHHGHGEIYMNAIITKPAKLYFDGIFLNGKIQSGTIYRNGVEFPFNAETSVDENGIPLIVN